MQMGREAWLLVLLRERSFFFIVALSRMPLASAAGNQDLPSAGSAGSGILKHFHTFSF